MDRHAPALRASQIAAAAAAVLLVAGGCSQHSNYKTAQIVPSTALVPGQDPPSSEGRAGVRAQLPADPFVDPNSPSAWRQPGYTGTYPTSHWAYPASQAMAGAVDPMIFGGEAPAMFSPAAGSPADDAAENLRQVSFAADGSDFDPTLSRDGSRLFFASTAHRTTSDIYMKQVDGRAVTQLTTDPANDVMPAASPDGSRVAFASNRMGSWDIFVMSAEGGQAVQITGEGSQELHPTWSPDGKYLAFCRLSETSNRWEIWVTEADRPSVRRFLTFGLFPDWHPTLNKIAFQRARDRGDRTFSIWTVNYTNGEATSPTEIATSTQAAVINPRWSPDGEYLACAAVPLSPCNEAGQRPVAADIWIMKADGSGRANLTGGRFVNLMPSWGPDNTVFFVSDRSGRDNIWGTSSNQAVVASGGVPGTNPSRQALKPHAPGHRQATQSHEQGSEGESEPAPEMANVPMTEEPQQH